MKRDRVDESRALMRRAMDFALGAYTEQEATKGDSWREADYTLGQAFGHLEHELEEVRTNLRRNDRRTFLVHNLVDMVALSSMLLAKVLLEGGEL